MKNLILISLLLFSSRGLCNGDPEVQIHDMEAERFAMHEKTSKQIADLNYFRMKIKAVDLATIRYFESAHKLTSLCKEQADLALCKSQTESLYSDIGNEINHLTALQTSDSFNRLTKNAFNNEIRIDSLFKDELNRLTSLKSTVFNLREKIGSLAAADEFHQKVFEIDHSRAQVAQERTCTFAASDLLKLYTSAMTDLNSAQPLSDGFLIVRAEKKIRDIRDRVSQAEKSCPSVNISTIKTYLASINTAQWDQRIHGIFEQSCSKVKSLNADAGAICRQKTINDNSLFYIHTLLNRNSGGVQ